MVTGRAQQAKQGGTRGLCSFELQHVGSGQVKAFGAFVRLCSIASRLALDYSEHPRRLLPVTIYFRFSRSLEGNCCPGAATNKLAVRHGGLRSASGDLPATQDGRRSTSTLAPSSRRRA